MRALRRFRPEFTRRAPVRIAAEYTFHSLLCLNVQIHIVMCQNAHLCEYPRKHSYVCLKLRLIFKDKECVVLDMRSWIWWDLKRTVHTKLKIQSSYFNSNCSKPLWFFVLLNIKEDTLKNDSNQLLVPNDSNYSVFFILWKSWGLSNCVITSKPIVPEQNFHFWVNYSSKAA